MALSSPARPEAKRKKPFKPQLLRLGSNQLDAYMWLEALRKEGSKDGRRKHEGTRKEERKDRMKAGREEGRKEGRKEGREEEGW